MRQHNFPYARIIKLAVFKGGNYIFGKIWPK